MQEISKGYVPPNTAKSIAWGVKVFQDWRAERSGRDKNEQCAMKLPILPSSTSGCLDLSLK